jgi:DNA-binding NarL/FixJ family response regulator
MADLGVVIQERRQLLRDGLAAVLEAAPGLRVDGLAETGPDLVEVVDAWPCDVLVLELEVESWDVPRLIKRLRTLRPEALITGLHRGRRSDLLRQADRLGVDAFVSYGLSAHALQRAACGHPLAAGSGPTIDRRKIPTSKLLTGRERAVLEHVAAGFTSEESAQRLAMSPKTIENHKQRIFSKLDVQNQAHAVAQAHRRGILRPKDRES